ncbi:helix-turn-helix domain-containing protein [Undibacterium sp. SXout7W]|uniref:helix-turn-helix domain-containing protein n=1 Tax=Undibacterium sp. SXout7W TaxID=3413049 RepID=UPI003BF027AF
MKNTKNVPVFKLYGEQSQWETFDLVHCESIASRSRLHNWEIKPHQHHGLFQILFLQSGTAQIQLDEQHYRLSGKQILLIPPMCIHGFKFAVDALGFVITIAYPLIARIDQQMGEVLTTLRHATIHALDNQESSQHISHTFHMIAEEYLHQSKHRNLMMESLLTTILVWVSRQSDRAHQKHGQENEKNGRHVGNFGRLIEEHYVKQHSVAFYAKQLGMTAAHLNVIVRQSTGHSALTLVHERLLLEAKRHLVYTNMSVSILSYALGFSDPAYFTRFFKRNTGIAPKDFRQQASKLFDM